MRTEYANTAKPDDSRPRWMLVDDDECMLKLLSYLLGAISNARIDCFRSAEDALAAFVQTPNAFDMVLTDLHMSGMDGTLFCHRLHDLAPELKVMLITGDYGFTDDDGRTHGFCQVLYKPISVSALRNAMRSVQTPTVSRRCELQTA
jgi:CheY-like chemotaxis protein